MLFSSLPAFQHVIKQSSRKLCRAALYATCAGLCLLSVVMAAADYDGDGKWDVAVFRPSSGTFYILQSTSNSLRADQFGANGDLPVPSAYVP